MSTLLYADSLGVGRGLAQGARQAFSLQAYFPQLHRLLSANSEISGILENYAKRIVQKDDLSGSQDLLDLMDYRDKEIIPLLKPYLENLDLSSDTLNHEALFKELAVLAMQPTMAEGTVTGLGARRLFRIDSRISTDAVSSQAQELLYYDAFQDAKTQTFSGEYPYMQAAPFLEMVINGEQILKNESASRLSDRVAYDFTKALEVVTDIHLVEGGNACTGGIHTDLYPYAFDIEGLKVQIERYKQSKYYPVISAILSNTSSIQDRPENIYLLLQKWEDNEGAAKASRLQLFDAGKDVPHVLPVKRGDGSTKYALVYRFYDNEKTANENFEKYKLKNPESELIFVSVKGEELYQIGM